MVPGAWHYQPSRVHSLEWQSSLYLYHLYGKTFMVKLFVDVVAGWGGAGQFYLVAGVGG